MNEELHETLCVLFIEIQNRGLYTALQIELIFSITLIHCTNCNLLDQTQYLPYIPMMKDRENN